MPASAAPPPFPPLAGTAFPAAQDRWERLVTMAEMPFPAGRVWEALVSPAHLRHWLAVCHGHWAEPDQESTLDFEDGEFFYCRTSQSMRPRGARPGTLIYQWRWVGIGPAATVTWTVRPVPGGTLVTVVEEATNPPSDWRSWNGMGWPGILDQLANYLRTGVDSRWPWRRMGPYLQIPLPQMPYAAWAALTSPPAVQHWLQRSAGSLTVGDPMTVVMGDASGTVELTVTKSVDAGQEFPSYMPYLEFELRRPSWRAALGGRLWIEPAGLGESLLQVFHHGWERLDIHDPVTERKLLTSFWTGAAARAQMLLGAGPSAAGPHGWTAGAAPSPEHNGAGPAPGAMNGHGGGPPAIDLPAAMAFGQTVLDHLGGAMTSLLVALGLRLGLLGALAAGPATSAELAAGTGLAERYVREWLWGLHSAGYLRLDAPAGRFTLPAEHAAVLGAPDSPMSMSAGFQLVPAMAGMLDEVAAAFRAGSGIGPEGFPESMYEAMEQMSATWLDALLVDQWLPSVDGLVERLRRGARVADVGSGSGRAVLAMARRFPASEFIGYDVYARNVARASELASGAGMADRVRFREADAAGDLTGPLDLITMFATLHDAPDPYALLGAARAALKPDGVLLIQESAAATPGENTGPAGQILYATSVLHCVPAALAAGGPALGTLGLPYETLAALAGKAGFGHVHEVPVQSPMNALFVLRP
ncbi:hypothetical protein GCM10012284_08180 [Mangrovihabitans endophyticus]|uniref:Methyltransferase domain-containing protein n=1 Tax=Mangrovihabitans endophyticus TaxID=1751298 RepID=A0A8J3FMJ7_9ACTN|nr:hypothetical protein GCM10012284_08180 [Mangrovihabitans endophyticus]